VTNASPIVFGEVLFDTFPDGQRILGGAPFNVAWHLSGFGCDPVFVSRVGDDESGREIVERAAAWGMSTVGIQVDGTRPTGRVTVRIENGEPAYEIARDQAYDYIEPPGTAARGSLLYHGSLALRSTASRRAVESVTRPELGVLCDLNLRPPWWTKEVVDWCLGRASWIKLSDGELDTITGLGASTRAECLRAGRELARRHGIENLVITRGSDGVLGIFDDGEIVWKDAPPTSTIVDTVGAGDAFSAVTIMGILKGWSHDRTLENATRFAADVCGQRGATAPDRALYDNRFD
jgi:fructokinase